MRGERTYQVRRGFPRLVEVDLPTGVGDVNFAVSLAACEPFAAPVSGMLNALSQTNPRRRDETIAQLDDGSSGDREVPKRHLECRDSAALVRRVLPMVAKGREA